MSMKVKTPRTLGVAPEGNFYGNITPFESLFSHKVTLQSQEDFEKMDCLILWGGTDIHPSFYNENHSKRSGAPTFISRRDEFEYKALLFCKKHDIPIIGICRGAQFGCAFAGGKVIQHVTGHGGPDHLLQTNTGEKFWSNSVHHQMMYPYNVDHELIAWACPSNSYVYINGEDESIEEMKQLQEPEIVYFPGIRCLAIQGHPEYPSATERFQKFCVEMASEKLFDEKLEMV